VKTAAPAKGVVESAFERRAARAEALGRESVAARAPLAFLAGLYGAHATAAARLERTSPSLTGKLDDDLPRVLAATADVLRYAGDSGPEPLAEAAVARVEEDPETAEMRLRVFWEGGPDTREDYLSRAILRPYFETLRAANRVPSRVHRQGHCPFCGGSPFVAARREGSEQEGARRMLVCSLCGGEWLLGRILCPSCFEEDPRKLPIFRTERYPAVRLETCDTCRRYVKSIDLSLDARPIPEVDEVVSLSMDLWATEEGYTRIHPGWAGL
jgi:formate dehydrogenase maturation protein FdhE